jgi:hypothetical protein
MSLTAVMASFRILLASLMMVIATLWVKRANTGKNVECGRGEEMGTRDETISEHNLKTKTCAERKGLFLQDGHDSKLMTHTRLMQNDRKR